MQHYLDKSDPAWKSSRYSEPAIRRITAS